MPSLPDSPGVYFFKNRLGDTIYIGKARSLKKRVASYFQETVIHADWKKEALMDEYVSLTYLTTTTELEASLLEAELIQQHRPKYNVLLRDGQPFLYILFTKEKPLSRMVLVRTKNQQGHYYGPFLQKQQARKAYEFLEKTFRLKLCNKDIPNGCLEYHIGICSGSCMATFDKDSYLFRLYLAESVLKKRDADFVAAIEDKMKQYNAALEFEKTRQLALYLHNLDHVFTTIALLSNDQGDTVQQKQFSLPALSHEVQMQIADQLQTWVGAAHPINSIDCFDISHFQSTHLVGAAVRFVHGAPDKNKCRRFIIKTLTTQNDYAALQEILLRRYRTLDDLPDLIMIDGGKGQRSAAIAVTPPKIPVVSLAKREERLHTPTCPDGMVLTMHDTTSKMLIALRDYAHHFAITFHRQRRSKKGII